MEHLDVLVIGAGISGIGAGYFLQDRCPDRSYAILEGRGSIGGTWDLFRYPGIRSDSDMHTFGYAFRPWRNDKAISDGDSILRYLDETTREYGIDRQIRFHHHVHAAAWSSADARWTLEVERKDTGETLRLTCNFLFMCVGYYNYEHGYTPRFEGVERFPGEVVHPQKWPEDLDHAGKRVVIIGSGATAITLVPAMAETAAHVTMLQRSPTYVLSVPAKDPIANFLKRTLPPDVAHTIARWKNVGLTALFFNLSRRAPAKIKQLLVDGIREELGPDYDVDKHFTPRYDPWDQRVCVVPDGDLFEAIRQGRASVVTDTIESFTEEGIALESGETLEADIIVTATGLDLLFLGGLRFSVDGEAIEPRDSMTYKAMMLSDVPNLAFAFGYTNASWTLKSDLSGEYVCRLLNHMSDRGYRRCVPRQRDPDLREVPFVDFTSGYIQRALAKLPKQGHKAPWRLDQSYARDILVLRHGDIVDGAMEFT